MARNLHDLERKSRPAPGREAGESATARAQALMTAKASIDSELEALFAYLSAQGTDLRAPVFDAEGFPRSDLGDLAGIRMARVRIHELRNDLRDVIEELKRAMEEAMPRGSDGAATGSQPNGGGRAEGGGGGGAATTVAPFAKVDSVIAGSPAERAGLRVGDRVLRFGPVNATNHDRLAAVGRLVQSSEGSELAVVVMRDVSSDGGGQEDGKGGAEEKKDKMVVLGLVPRSGWGGRGLLGCHIRAV